MCGGRESVECGRAHVGAIPPAESGAIERQRVRLDTGSAVEYSLAVRVERADIPEVAVSTGDPAD
jgi:hypothetical protein